MAVALEAFCLMTFQMLCGRKKKAPSNFSITPRLNLDTRHI